MQEEKTKVSDIVSGVILTALGVYIIFEASDWGFLSKDGPGPGFMPIGVGVALVALSLGQVLGALSAAPTGGTAEIRQDGRSVPRALCAWAAFAVAIVLLKPLGFVLSFTLLTFFLVVVMYRRRVITGLAVSLLSTAGFYLVFVIALRLKLPAGPLGF